MNISRLAIILVFSLGFLCFSVAVVLSFMVKGGGIFALGGLGVALMTCSPFAGLITDEFKE